MNSGCGGCGGSYPALPPAVVPIMKPMFTGSFTEHDFCEVVTVGDGGVVSVPVRQDPNMGMRAAYAVFTGMGGDYAVSLDGGVDFSATGKFLPLLSPRIVSLAEVVDMRVWAKHGTSVKICWYCSKPQGEPLDVPWFAGSALLEKMLAALGKGSAGSEAMVAGLTAINVKLGEMAETLNAMATSIGDELGDDVDAIGKGIGDLLLEEVKTNAKLDGLLTEAGEANDKLDAVVAALKAGGVPTPTPTPTPTSSGKLI